MTIRVDMGDVQALVKRFPAMLPAAERETKRVMTRVVIEGEARAKKGVSRDTSHYARSITHRVSSSPGIVVGQYGSNVPYAPAREFGRRPGAKMPPRGSLLAWLRRHGIPAEMEFVIRRRIGRRGIPGEHVFRDTLAALKPLAEREFAGVKGTLIAAMNGRGGAR